VKVRALNPLVLAAEDSTQSLVFSVQPTSGVVNADLATQPILQFRYSSGSVVNRTDTVTLTAYSDSTCQTLALGTLNSASRAATAGTATFTGVDYSIAETIYLQASSGTLTSACSNAIVIAPPFGALTSTVAGANAQWVETADLNRDGILDLVVAEQNVNQFSVWMGVGNGTFAAKVNYATGGGTDPRSVRVADLDRDGDLDLVICYWTTRVLGIWLNNGSGVFAAIASVGNGTASMFHPAIVDVNGDGILDIVAPRFNTTNMAVHMGVGNGTFGVAANYGTNTLPVYVESGDFDSDGDADILVSSFNTTNLAYLANNGNGTFAAKVNIAVAGIENGVIRTADLNHDGNLDFIVADEVNQTIGVFLGNGNGTFAARVDYNTSATGQPGGRIMVALVFDVNKDGALDIVLNAQNPDVVDVLYGVGDGTFGTPAGDIAQVTGSFGLTAGDFNQDGQKDLAGIGMTGGVLSVHLANPVSLPGTFTMQSSFSTIAEPRDTIAADMNQDGNLDLLVASSSAGANLLRLHPGAGDGTFAAGSSFSLGAASVTNTNIIRLATADFDGDGDLDVASVIADSNFLTVAMGDGAGSFAAAATYASGTDPRHLAIGDFDRDGDVDVAVANHDTNNASIFINNGAGVFAAAVNYATANTPKAIAVGDVNRDGILDLAVSTDNANVSTLLGVGNGTFAAANSYAAPANGADITLEDVDRDGMPDLIVAQGASGRVTVYLGDGSGAYNTSADYVTSQTTENLGLGDFDSDGDLDVACTLTSGTEKFTTFRNNGSGVYASQADLATSAATPQGLAQGDFNHDGKIDFATASWGASVIRVFLGDSW
jgi:hypothetical protein